jgi:hypothetical protein
MFAVGWGANQFSPSVSLAIVVLPEEVTSAQSLSAGFAGLSLRRTAEGDITQGSQFRVTMR